MINKPEKTKLGTISRRNSSFFSPKVKPSIVRIVPRSKTYDVELDIVHNECYKNLLSQNDEEENGHKIKTTLRPFILFARILGVISPKKSKFAHYFIILFIFLPFFIYVVSMLTILCEAQSFDPIFVANLLILTHFFKVIVSTYYLSKMLGRTSDSLYKLWEEMVQGYHRSTVAENTKYWVTFGMLYIFSCSTASLVAGIWHSFHGGFYLFNFSNILHGDNLKYLEILLIFIAAIYNNLCLTTYASLCLAIYHEFNLLVTKWRLDEMDAGAEKRLMSLTRFRLYHHHIVKLTDILDDTVSYYAFWILSINVPMLFSAIFLMGTGQWSTNDVLTLLCCTIALVNEILMILLPPSAIACWATKPLYYVHEVSNTTDDKNREQQNTNMYTDSDEDDLISRQTYNQISLFIQQINSRSIGVTCGGFFVLRKEVLLTILPMMFTYFKLIRQLALTSKFHCSCDCEDK